MADQVEQRSDEWFEARRGKSTASRFADAMAFGTPDKYGVRKPQAARGSYMRQLAFERMAGKPKHAVTSKSLAWGTELEDPALEAYQLHTGRIATKAEFVVHPVYAFIGASPDALVDANRGAEIKCPFSEEVHIATWLNGMPEDHKYQVQGNLFVTGREVWDFISYDPRQCPRLQLYVESIERDEVFIKRLEAGLLQFEMELQAMVKQLDLAAA
ncbi:putative phage-type endonuclease [Polaromonas sp. OV174]|uniref:lambda exonuclease family protein n=1 Tax=Polaromonas sp. OV174 TaxID=1855300 RepID=UPI0008EDD01C|nr:lambda exonuclease family protein [Polaromonas sp. OV174]SFB74671.1 putative phage-type endonuclease [Polaromonas sp. OV174]